MNFLLHLPNEKPGSCNQNAFCNREFWWEKKGNCVCDFRFMLLWLLLFFFVELNLALVFRFFMFNFVFFVCFSSLLLLSAQQSFDYTELCQPATILDSNAIPVSVNAMQRVGLHTNSSSPNASISSQPSTRSRPWHDFGRQNDADKIQIPKM